MPGFDSSCGAVLHGDETWEERLVQPLRRLEAQARLDVRSSLPDLEP